MANRQILFISSSTVHGYGYLEHPKDAILDILKKNLVKKVLFVPYASSKHNDYLNKVNDVLSKWGFQCEGIHNTKSQVEAVRNAEAIFIGGGNSFLLLKSLYDNNLIEPIRRRILNEGIPYIGSSAGTNVATDSIRTTNDMPIVYPPSFTALQLVNFNINPHYLDPDVNSVHKGETREDRIKEFHEHNDNPVIGLREGSCLLINGSEIKLIGDRNIRLFKKDEKPDEISPNTDINFLLNNN